MAYKTIAVLTSALLITGCAEVLSPKVQIPEVIATINQGTWYPSPNNLPIKVELNLTQFQFSDNRFECTTKVIVENVSDKTNRPRDFQYADLSLQLVFDKHQPVTFNLIFKEESALTAGRRLVIVDPFASNGYRSSTCPDLLRINTTANAR